MPESDDEILKPMQLTSAVVFAATCCHKVVHVVGCMLFESHDTIS